MAQYLQFENKGLIETLKAEKKNEIEIKSWIYLVKRMMIHSYFYLQEYKLLAIFLMIKKLKKSSKREM